MSVFHLWPRQKLVSATLVLIRANDIKMVVIALSHACRKLAVLLHP